MGLRAEGLAAFRGERLVLRDLSLLARAGRRAAADRAERLGQVTLLRLLAGPARPDAGAITWDGADIAEDPAAHARRLRYLGHLDAVKPGLTVAENLRFPARIAGGARGGGARSGRSRPARRPAGADAVGRPAPAPRAGAAGARRGAALAARRADARPRRPRGGALRRAAGGASRAAAAWWWRRRICRCRCRAPTRLRLGA